MHGLLHDVRHCTGASEKTLKRVGRPYQKIYIHANNHAGYYPNARTVDFKLLFDPQVGGW
jgi:hypothetical protein